MSELAAIPLPEKPVQGPDTARALFWRLVWLYQGGCFTALSVTMLLVLLGLEFTFFQWCVLFVETPIVVAIYNLSDVYVIRRHCRPIAAALRILDSGEPPPEAVT